jgi:hypothetical protein
MPSASVCAIASGTPSARRKATTISWGRLDSSAIRKPLSVKNIERYGRVETHPSRCSRAIVRITS